MVKSFITLLLSFALVISASSTPADSSFNESRLVLHTPSGDIYGTLTTPVSQSPTPIALIIAGSGPTDRDGNNPMMKNESLRKLAYSLAENNIASLRFDKRGIGESAKAMKAEADLRFNDYVNDAIAWIALLKKDKRFSKLIVVGHSEGSLIGMIAAKDGADGFVSIAGAGKSADKILKDQLSKQPAQIRDMCFPIIDSLAEGKQVKEVNPMLYSLFRPSVQPYMISWFQYDPQTEIAKLSVPVLVVQGTHDIQVSQEDAQLLAAANPKSQMVLVKDMNHIFRIVGEDRKENIASYSDGSLPISTEMANRIVQFIKTFKVQ